MTTPAEKDQKPNTAATPGGQKGDAPAPATRGVTVRVMQPIVREVSDHDEFVGYIVAAREVELRARTSGTLVAVYCRPGQLVKLDERLFKIDPRLYKAELDRAEAELERVRARRTQKHNELAATNKLVEKHVVSHEEAQHFEVELLEADAAVKVAEAARDVSRLNLEFTEVTAPFAGRVSGPILGQGNVAVADTTRLATIVSTDRVWVTFNVPENISLRFRRLRSKPYEGQDEVVVGLADGTDYPHRGKIESIEVGFDTATGTARWRASIPNPDGLLLPGMSVRVRMVTSAPHKAMLVPEEAVMADSGQKSVLVVTGQDIVQRRPVRIGPIHDGLRSVEGLQADEWVVIEGMSRLREGAKVQAMRVPPPAEPSPPPQSKQ